MKKRTTLLTIILLASASLFAQLGEIKGIIKDENGGPMPGVTVHIEVGGNMIGAATDAYGKYTLKPVKAGMHTVQISAMGYKKAKITDVLVTSGSIAYVNNDMEVLVNDMETYTVVEKMHVIPLLDKAEPGVQHIIPKEFQRSVNRMNPVQAIVSMSAGLTVASNGKDVYVRGARPQSTQFITDGMKSINGEIGIPGLAVGSAKVYTSGVPAAYGDFTGGVIVVETKSYFDLAQKFK